MPIRALLAIMAGSVYVFLLAPFVVIAIGSLDGSQSLFYNFPPQRISLAWYGQIPSKYFQAFAVSVWAAGIAALCSSCIGIVAALGLARSNIPAKELFHAFFRLPLQIPFVVTGVVFLQFYVRLADIGVSVAGSFWGMVIAYIFVTTPYSVGAVSAVLSRMNMRLEEAAETLGASRWSTFRRVTFPLMRPGVFAGMLYAFVVAFGDVSVAVFLSGPETVTLPVEIFQSMQLDFEPSILALSTLVVLFSVGLIIVIQRWVGLDIVVQTGQR